MSDINVCNCPMCGTETIPKNQDSTYLVTTYNPTLPYAHNVYEYVCDSCKQQWFLNSDKN